MVFAGDFEGLDRQRGIAWRGADSLGLLEQKGLLRGRTLGIDATTLEANAAMKGIARKDSGAGWQGHLRTLAQAGRP